MTIDGVLQRRKLSPKHSRISSDPLTKPKRELRKIARIAKAR
jgi:hypothetical protein